MKTRWAIVSAAILLASAVVAAAAKPLTLQRKYPPGTYVVTQDQDMQTATGLPGMGEIKQDAKITFVAELTIAKPDTQGRQQIVLQYKRIRMNVGGPMKMSYDSARQGQADAMFAQMFQPMLAAKIEMTVDRNGKVLETKGADKLMDSIARGNPMAAGMLQGMKGQVNDQMLKNMISQGDQFLPTKPVRKGDTWTARSTQDIPMMGQTKSNFACKLADVRKTGGHTLATISVKGKMTSGQSKKVKGGGPIPMKLTKVVIAQQGTVTFDADTGMFTEVKLNMDATMNATVEAGAGGQGMAMTIKLKGVSTVTTKPGKYQPPKPQPKKQTYDQKY